MATKTERTTIREWALKKGERYRVREEQTFAGPVMVVDVYGQMPNSTEIGWWVAGSLKELITDIDHGHR